MSRSIFETLSVDRTVIRWEDHLRTLTPVENHRGVWFKREDYFAPLGYGGPNGSKMRQLIWVMSSRRAGKTHVLSGASVRSPQLSMSAIVGAHYGLQTRLVVGATKPATLKRHPNPYVALGFGAHFEYINVAYNPALQREVARLTQPESLVVEYGITLDHKKHDSAQVYGFHDVGAHQVTNIPPEVRTLVVPAGSCNSLGSVLLGLSRDSKNVSTLFTLGIGPSKQSWLRDRMNSIGVDVDRLPFAWKHFSLHDTGYSTYQDMVKESFDGIEFHPTYEAKCIRWLKEKGWVNEDDTSMFWIVGSEPKIPLIKPYFTHQVES
jgi:1-aminocyclopropane-1-carboxylate deaminase/D-cysteine desulfhydrase-like pyridoxal-dependent ACC family enzyme